MADSAIVYTKDHDDALYAGLKALAAEICPGQPAMTIAKNMACVMMAESGVYAAAHNPNGHASGLIQFMPQTLENLGWKKGHEAFRKLTATQQLPFVRAYYAPYKNQLESIASFYVATFLPALLIHASDREYALVVKGGKLGWAYAPNVGFDRNGDGIIKVRELEDAVVRQCQGPRWAEILHRLTGEEPAIDLRTTIGIQRALTRLGFDPGPIDGVPGFRTRSAVMAYQKSRNLVVDGIPGPITRGSLAADIQ